MDKETLMKNAKKILFSCHTQIALLERKNDEEEERYKLFGSNQDENSGNSLQHIENKLQQNLTQLDTHCNKLSKFIVPNKNDNFWRFFFFLII